MKIQRYKKYNFSFIFANFTAFFYENDILLLKKYKLTCKSHFFLVTLWLVWMYQQNYDTDNV